MKNLYKISVVKPQGKGLVIENSYILLKNHNGRDCLGNLGMDERGWNW
jgi:hypothetical protein